MTTMILLLQVCAWWGPTECEREFTVSSGMMAPGICRLEAVRLHREWLVSTRAGHLPEVVVRGVAYDLLGASCHVPCGMTQ